MNKGVLSKIHGFATWFSNLVYINILWLTFILLGGVFLGFFPATIAMLFIIKKLMVEKDGFSIGKEFIGAFKREFRKSNQLFYPFILCGFIIIMDIRFISSLNFMYSHLVVKLFYILVFLLVMVFLYSLVVYINGIVGKREILKKSIQLLINNPMTNLYILTGVLLLQFLVVKITGVFFMFSGALFSWFLLITVSKITKKLYQ